MNNADQPREEALARLREAEKEDIVKRRAAALGLLYINLRGVPLEIEALKIIPEAKARAAGILVFAKKPKEFSVAVLDPDRPETKEVLKEIEKFGRANIYLVSPENFDQYLANYRLVPKEREKLVGELILSQAAVADFKAKQMTFEELGRQLSAEAGDISALTQKIFASALSLEASDIHLEPAEEGMSVRYRIDGVLYRIGNLGKNLSAQLRDRIKLMAELKLNIKDAPQDGRFSIKTERETIEVRVSAVPGPYGENIVMRLLLPKAIEKRLEDLGLRDDDLAILRRELKRPNGMIIVTGPTGSGKTTTLYAALKQIASPEIKIITIEDPIEYRLAGIEQTQTEPERGYDFANGLRAILRQDPDVILVGEIRDRDTASIAMHASLTGHLVFSTLHTNDAAGTIPRLVDLGIEPKIIAAAMNLAVAQRLLRRLCPDCSVETKLTEAMVAKIAPPLQSLPQRAGSVKLKAGLAIRKVGAGCQACYGTGYRGRVGVFELMEIGAEMKNLIHGSPTEVAIYQLATKQGMVTMMQDALLKMLAGITDLAEIERVVGPFVT